MFDIPWVMVNGGPGRGIGDLGGFTLSGVRPPVSDGGLVRPSGSSYPVNLCALLSLSFVVLGEGPSLRNMRKGGTGRLQMAKGVGTLQHSGVSCAAVVISRHQFSGNDSQESRLLCLKVFSGNYRPCERPSRECWKISAGPLRRARSVRTFSTASCRLYSRVGEWSRRWHWRPLPSLSWICPVQCLVRAHLHGQPLPFQLFLIPLYLFLNSLGLYDTRLGLSVVVHWDLRALCALRVS